MPVIIFLVYNFKDKKCEVFLWSFSPSLVSKTSKLEIFFFKNYYFSEISDLDLVNWLFWLEEIKIWRKIGVKQAVVRLKTLGVDVLAKTVAHVSQRDNEK